MRVFVNASAVLSGKGYENFSGILSISFPEMKINKRQITFLATKRSDGSSLAVSFFRDNELLFSITDFNNGDCEVDMEERYGRSLDGKNQSGLCIMDALRKCVAGVIGILEKEVVENELAFYKGICSQFILTGFDDERDHEIICLMCRTRVRESTKR